MSDPGSAPLTPPRRGWLPWLLLIVWLGWIAFLAWTSRPYWGAPRDDPNRAPSAPKAIRS